MKDKMNDIFLSFGGDLVFVRHGENIINSAISNDFLPLTELGIKQAEEVKKIIGDNFDVVISSISMRCIMTAKIIMNGGDPIKEIRLLERGWGNKEQDGRETDEQAKERLLFFLKDISKRYHQKRVVIVTHGALMRLAQDVIENNCIKREHINNCDIIEYNRNGKKKVIKATNYVCFSQEM